MSQASRLSGGRLSAGETQPSTHRRPLHRRSRARCTLSAHFLREAVIGSGRQAGRNPWCGHGIRPPARPPLSATTPAALPSASTWRSRLAIRASHPVKLREQWSPAKARAVSLAGVQVGKKARRAALQKPSLAGPAVSNSIPAPYSQHRRLIHRRLADLARSKGCARPSGRMPGCLGHGH